MVNNRKAPILMAMACVLALLPGCLPSVQLKDRAIVQAMGVDFGMGLYELTLQIFAPNGGEDGGGDNQYTVVKTQGSSLTEAFEKAGDMLGQRIFLGNSKVLVVGRPTAEKGLQYIADYFNQNQQTRATLLLIVADGLASEVLPTDLTTSPAHIMEHEVEQAEENGLLTKSRMMDVIAAAEGDGRDATVPIVHMEETAAGESQPHLMGLGAVRNGLLAGDLTLTQSTALQWCLGGITRIPVTLQVPGVGRISVLMDRNRSRITCSITEDDLPSFHIQVKSEGEITEIINTRLVEIGPSQINQIEKLLAQELSGQIQSMVQSAVYQYNTDVLMLGDRLQQQQYAYWERRAGDWRDVLGQTRFTLSVDCSLRRRNAQAQDPEY